MLYNAFRKGIAAVYVTVPIPRRSKAKNAQEAHEAIRPTKPGRVPDQAQLPKDSQLAQLYSLIWARALASQMRSASLLQVPAPLLILLHGYCLPLAWVRFLLCFCLTRGICVSTSLLSDRRVAWNLAQVLAPFLVL